jgi:hypothetical protein
VKLNYFTAEKVKESVRVQWSTSIEYNSKEYVVERSSNGNQFEQIGKVAANGRPSKYEFIDVSPLIGNNYYRLRSVDMDEKAAYSKSVRVVFDTEIMVKISPNPAHLFFNLSLENKGLPVNVTIVDQEGRSVKQMNGVTTGGAPIRVDVSGLGQGLYFIKVTGQNTVTQKLVIY